MKPKHGRFGLLASSIVTLSFTLTSIASAANGTWTSNADGNWAIATTAPWAGGIVADGADANADFSTLDITANRAVTMTEDRTIGNMLFDDTGATADSNWIVSRSTTTPVLTMQTTTGTPTITVTNTATLGNGNGFNLAGTQGFVKAGTGTLIFNDNNGNTYSGITTVSAGTLQIGGLVSNVGVQGRVGPTSTEIAIASGATLSAYYANNGISQLISGAGNFSSVTPFGGGGITIPVTGPNTYTGTTTIGATIISVNTWANGGSPSSLGASSNAATNLKIGGSSTIAFNGTAPASTDRLFQLTGTSTLSNNSVTPNSLTFSNTGAIAFDATNSGRSFNLGGSNTDANVFALSIPDNGTGVVTLGKSGTGTWALTNTNSFTGTTTVSGGRLKLDYTTNNTNKISATNPLVLSGGSTVEFIGNASAPTSQNVKGLTLTGSNILRLTTAGGQTTAVDFTANSGTLTRTAGSLDVFVSGPGTGSIKIPGTTPSTPKVLWATYNGGFAATDASNFLIGSASTLTSQNDLSLWTSGSKQYSNTAAWTNAVGADVTIDGFTFAAPVASTVTIGTGNTLIVNDGVIVSSTVGANASVVTGGSLQGAAGVPLTFLQSNPASTLTVSSTLANNSGTSLVKEGSGTMIVSSDSNAYTGGTIVNGGELQALVTVGAGAKSGFGSGSITANAGTTLRFKTGSTGNAQSYANNLNINNASLISEDGVVTMTGAANFTGTNSINVVWGGKTLNLAGNVTGSGTLNLANSNASTLILSGTSTYSGAVNLGTNSALSIATGANVTGMGAIGLNANGAALTVSGNLSSGAVTASTAATTSVTVNAGGTFTPTSFSAAYTSNAVINGTYNPGSLNWSTNSTNAITGTGIINSGAVLVRNFSIITYAGGTWNNSGNFFLGDASGQSGSFTQTAGTVNLTTTAGLGMRIGHWAASTNTSTLTVSGGTLNATGTDMDIGYDGNGALTVAGGTVNLRGLSLTTPGRAAVTGTLNLTSGTLNIGTGGITKGQATGTAVANLGAGTLGARGADWASSLPMVLTAATTPTINTLDSVDVTTARSITLSGILSGTGGLVKSNAGTLTLSGANAYGGTTTVNGGTLTLNYATQDNTKLSDTAALTLGTATLNLVGGTHGETVASTVVTGKATINRTSGLAVMNLKTITPTPGASLNLTASGIATTDNITPSGALGAWATINGTDLAFNSSNAIGGLITAPVYTDVNRMGGTIASSATSNVRIVDAGTTGTVTLAAAGTSEIGSIVNAVTTGATTLDLTGNTLRFANNGGIFNPSASQALSLMAGTITSGTGVDTAGTLVINNASTVGNVSVSSVIANNGIGVVSVSKLGVGKVIMTGASTYTGATLVGEGSLTIGSVTALGTVDAGTTVSSGAALELQGGIAIGLETLSINGTGVSGNGALRNVSGNNTYGGAVTLAGASSIQSDAGTLTVSNTVSGSGLTLTKTGAGTVSFSNAGSPSLPTNIVINQGTVNFAGGAFGGDKLSGSGTVTVNAGATMTTSQAHALGGGNVGMSESVIINGGTMTLGSEQYFAGLAMNGATVNGAGQVRASGSCNFVVTGSVASTMSNGVSLYNTMTANVADVTANANADFSISGVIENTGGITKTGAGTLLLTGTNTYSGTTTITAGTVQIGNGGATGTPGTGAVINNAAFVINRNATADLTIAGAISGTGTVTQAGAGKTIFTAANTYSGATTVSVGNLTVNNTTGSGTGTSAVSVSSGATLSGTGAVSGSVTNAGTIAPGNAGTGTLTTGSLALTGTYAAEINGVANDRITVNGDLNLTGATLNITSTSPTEAVYVIASYTGTLTGSFGTVTGLPANYSVFNNTASKQIEVKLSASAFSTWTGLYPALGANIGKGDNPDGDGLNNFGEFAFDGSPVSGVNDGKIVTKVATIGGSQYLTLTIPVRVGSPAASFATVGAEQVATSSDGVVYHIQGSDTLSTFAVNVVEVIGTDATAIQTGLPSLTNPSWTYHTFRLSTPISGATKGFIRAKVTE